MALGKSMLKEIALIFNSNYKVEGAYGLTRLFQIAQVYILRNVLYRVLCVWMYVVCTSAVNVFLFISTTGYPNG